MKCPKCGSKMVLRTARRGPNPGNQFYGCSMYPNCTQTVSINATSIKKENAANASLKVDRLQNNNEDASTVADAEILPMVSSFIKQKPREKQMYLGNYIDMEKYSANYAYSNHNFVIQNNTGLLKKNSKYYSVFCILKNILQRGCPTIMSEYLQKNLGAIHNEEEFEDPITFISKEVPIWTDVIKGNSEQNDYPALDFFEYIIPEYIPEFKFIQQLILPEVLLSEITLDNNEKFEAQQVDFYVPQAKLVIEIDGHQHKSDRISRVQDQQRDRYLKKFGVRTIRINTQDIRQKTEILEMKMSEIRNRLEEYFHNLEDYKNFFENQESLLEDSYTNSVVRSTAIIRFQILILSLLQTGKLNLEHKQWKLSVARWEDVGNFEELALEDLFMWIKNLCKLLKLKFNKPELIIKKYHPEDQKSFIGYSEENYINIDFSLFKRWTDEHKSNPNSIYVRTDYFDQYNYFKVSTTCSPIDYDINITGGKSDKPALDFFLKNIFGFNEFMDGQLPSVINALMRNDTIGLLPTGGGKSLIYQFVGLLQPTISFIVAPIISLMKDQRDNLDKFYISNTQFINSTQSAEEKERTHLEYGQGKYQFIWISPERFQTTQFRNELVEIDNNFNIGLAVIDEVHCLSEWGHDFRTSYLNLAKTIRKYCPSAKILGLTATASKHVLTDIQNEFDIGIFNIKTPSSFTREELSFKIIKDKGTSDNLKKQNLEQLLGKLAIEKKIFNLDGDDTKSGIIFTRNVNGPLGCYQLSNHIKGKFKEHNADIRWYSGSSPRTRNMPIMSSQTLNQYKERVQEDFQENKFPLLVATKAFGMGIDKSNIRYTVHYGVPGSLEALYQEAGRAGRDKEEAECYILLSEENTGKQYLKKLFDLKTAVQDIANIQEKVKYEGRDVFGQIFLWLSHARDSKDEFKYINKIFKEYANPNKKVVIECNKVGMTKSVLEKAIYKLSLLGIVEDWVIKNWNGFHGIIEVEFGEYDDNNIEKELLHYIRKYDPKFDLEVEGLDDSKAWYDNIYYSTEYNNVEKMIMILLEWSYENIAYFRRESIKTVYEQCMKEQSEEDFKKFMESYFRFDDIAFSFDSIAENPDNYQQWFNALLRGDRITVLETNKLNDLKGSLRRFLESYRFNTGLNYIDGMLRLLTNEANNQESVERLESAFKEIKKYNVEDQEEIFKNTVFLGRNMKDKDKEVVSYILNEFYEDRSYEIYQSLNDNYSLYYFMNNVTDKIKQGIGGE